MPTAEERKYQSHKEEAFSWRSAHRWMAFLSQGADAAFAATLKGWGGIKARRIRRRPPEVRRTEHVGEREEPVRGVS